MQNLVKGLKTTKNPAEVRNRQNKIKERSKELKNSYYSELAKNINAAAIARVLEKEFVIQKEYSTIKKGCKLSISNDKLRDHFKEHFAGRVPQVEIPPEQCQQENFPYLQDVKVTVNEDPPTAEEMDHVLKTF